jgi:hypothetical protein
MLLSAPLTSARAQTTAPPAVADTTTEPKPLLAWAFLRLGAGSLGPRIPARTPDDQVPSLSAGLAGSIGPFVGMARFTDSEAIFEGPGVEDQALLAGVRSGGHDLFVVGAAGLARAKAVENFDNGSGTHGPSEAALAYDLSAHADFRIIGLGLAVSGVVGAERTTYIALTLGLELGWFGS